MKSSIAFVGFALAVVLILIFLSSRSKVPLVPDDFFHRGVTNNAACTTCHTPGKQAPLQKSHPPKEECLFCHLFKERMGIR
jgi:hypothetical protein